MPEVFEEGITDKRLRVASENDSLNERIEFLHLLDQRRPTGFHLTIWCRAD